jgi:hypothetical protein
MKPKNALVVTGCVIVLSILFWLRYELPRESPPKDNNVQAPVNAAPPRTIPPNGSETITQLKASPIPVQAPTYKLEPVTVAFDSTPAARRNKTLPFRLLGSGGNAKIVNAAGDSIIESKPGKGEAIFGCEVSPDDQRLIIYRGDATYDVLTPTTGNTIRLPGEPPGGTIGFDSWHWIGNDTIVGVSGKVLPFRDDQTGPAREEPNISRSTLYLYHLSELKLQEVELPPEVKDKIFSVGGVDPSGKVELRPAGRESLSDATFGWFNLRLK